MTEVDAMDARPPDDADGPALLRFAFVTTMRN